MKLNSFSVKCIKSVADLRLQPRSNLTVFIGPNNVGKSTILQALRLPQYLFRTSWPFTGQGLDVVTGKNSVATPEIVFDVTFTDSELAQMDPVFRNAFPGRFKIAFDVKFPGTDRQLYVTSIAAEDHSEKWSRFWTRTGGGRYEANFGGSTSVQGIPDTSGNWMGEIQKGFAESRITALDPVRLLVRQMFFYDPLRSIAEYTPLSGSADLEGTGASLARHLADWQLSQDSRLTRYRTLVESLCPGLGQLVTPRVDNNCFVGFRRGDITINVSAMGTGVHQLLILAYHLVAREGRILALEEPESHLHPSAQRALAQAIREASEAQCVLVATHSPLFVDKVDCENNLCVSLDGNGHTQVANLSPADPLRPARDALGVTLGDSLYAGDVVVVVEGPTELSVLPLLSRKMRMAGRPYIPFERVAVVNMGGIPNLRATIRMLQPLGVPVFALVDSDNNARQKVKSCVADKLIADDHVFMVKRLGTDEKELPAEFEDLFPLTTYLIGVKERYALDITEEEFNRLKLQLLNRPATRSKTRRTDIVSRLLVEHGVIRSMDDYDKVEVAIAAATALSPEHSIGVLDDLARSVTSAMR